MSMNLDEIVDIFEVLGDWEQRYEYLVELGEKLPPMPEEYKTEENKVKGCMSQVWIKAYRDPDDPKRIHFWGDCDTAIIKGVLALILQMVDGMTLEEIEKLDVDEFFDRLKLGEHLSPNRHFGVYSLVEMMKQQARELQAESA
jgi:cysteine desulfuration protein SufE